VLHDRCETWYVSLQCRRIELSRLGILRIPSVESTIVPSKSERTPSKVCTSGGAEKVLGEMVMVGEGLAERCQVLIENKRTKVWKKVAGIANWKC